MIKKLFSTVLCLGLLGLSACSSEKKEQKSAQVIEADAASTTNNELNTVAQVAENESVDSELAQEAPAQKEA